MSNLVQRYRHLNTANEGFKATLDDRAGLIEDILTRVVIDSIRRYQQRLQVGIQDSVTDLLAAFKLQMAEEIYKAAQNWTLVTHRQPILFPPSCRYLYTIGSSTVVIIEQEPIVRTLRLNQRLFYRFGLDDIPYLVQTKRLGIPYTVFIIQFHNTVADGSGVESFSNLYIGWRSSPLSSLDDQIYIPYLPNIRPDYTVCTGRIDLKSSQMGGAGISELTQKVITNFWNSDFNMDLSTHWYKKSTVPQIATVEEWEKNSIQDPLFILGVPLLLPMTGASTINGVIKMICTAAEQPPIDLRHQISEMTDSMSARLFQGIKNYVFKTKFDRFYPKDITDNVVKVMESFAKQLRTIALAIEIQLDDISQELKTIRKSGYGWQKRSSLWKDREKE